MIAGFLEGFVQYASSKGKVMLPVALRQTRLAR